MQNSRRLVLGAVLAVLAFGATARPIWSLQMPPAWGATLASDNVLCIRSTCFVANELIVRFADGISDPPGRAESLAERYGARMEPSFGGAFLLTFPQVRSLEEFLALERRLELTPGVKSTSPQVFGTLY